MSITFRISGEIISNACVILIISIRPHLFLIDQTIRNRKPATKLDHAGA